MENRDQERGENLQSKGAKAHGRTGSRPCPPQLFSNLWDEALGPFKAKPFTSDLALVDECIRQEAALMEFLPEWGIANDLLRELKSHRVAGGAEHHVFVIDPKRVWKQTIYPRWGFIRDTPKDYLARLAALDLYAEELEILVEGIVLETGVPSLITSMAYIHGRHPQPLELHEKLLSDGWERASDDSQLLAYRHPETKVVLRDAHPGNFIVSGKKYVPIDVAIENLPPAF